MKTRYLAALILLTGTSGAAQALDLGKVGPVYPIAEESFIEVAKRRLIEMQESGQLADINRRREATARAYIEAPPRVVGLTRAKTDRSYYVDASITLGRDILDQQGNVLYAAGTRVNPLHHMVLSRPMLFFDAADPEQLAWAAKTMAEANPKPVVILVGGKLKPAYEALGTRIYFDQRGYITGRLQIRAVPAVAQQAGEFLQVNEIAIN